MSKLDWESSLAWFPCPVPGCNGLIRIKATGTVWVDVTYDRIGSTIDIDRSMWDLHMEKNHGKPEAA